MEIGYYDMRFVMIFLKLPRLMVGQCLKLIHDHLLPQPL